MPSPGALQGISVTVTEKHLDYGPLLQLLRSGKTLEAVRWRLTGLVGVGRRDRQLVLAVSPLVSHKAPFQALFVSGLNASPRWIVALCLALC